MNSKDSKNRRVAKAVTALLTALILLLTATFVFFTVRYPNRYRQIIQTQSQKYGLDPNLVRGVIWAESKFRPNAVSSRGARGLMQLLPSTAKWCAEQIGQLYDESLLAEPETNIALGAFYLNYLFCKFDNTSAIAAYNAGEGKVSGWLAAGLKTVDFPYRETRDYVKRVFRARAIYAYRN